MADPGEPVTERKAQQDEPGIAQNESRGQAEEAQWAADEMQ